MDRTPEIVREWWNKAEHDLEIASLALEHKPNLIDNICFHCQQASEKYIKSYLTYKNIYFKRSHDLHYLVDLIADNTDLMNDLYEQIDKFQDFATDLRYPNFTINPTLEEANDVFNAALLIKEIVKKHIAIK